MIFQAKILGVFGSILMVVGQGSVFAPNFVSLWRGSFRICNPNPPNWSKLQILERFCFTSWILYNSRMICVRCLFLWVIYLHVVSQNISNSAGPRLVCLWLQTLVGIGILSNSLQSTEVFTDIAIHHWMILYKHIVFLSQSSNRCLKQNYCVKSMPNW